MTKKPTDKSYYQAEFQPAASVRAYAEPNVATSDDTFAGAEMVEELTPCQLRSDDIAQMQSDLLDNLIGVMSREHTNPDGTVHRLSPDAATLKVVYSYLKDHDMIDADVVPAAEEIRGRLRLRQYKLS